MDKAVSDLWWKNAVVYCLDVETFLDTDGNGVGDLRGVTRAVDYLAGLGVTCIWFMPCYPTPNRDDGYDVSDYYDVDPRLGTLGDMVELLRTARERGIRVIADLVVNHTSVDHPWFQSARSDPGSRHRDWYVWSDEPLDRPEKVIFPDVEDSNWAYDEQAGQYYLHRFYSSEPDLNVANPDVRDEIHRVIGFWLELGLSGFRVDAVPYLIGEAGVWEEMPDEPHDVLRDLRAFLSRRRGDAVLFGEVNLDPGERTDFFGMLGEEMTGLFNFILAGAVFAALAEGRAEPLARHLRETPRPPREAQWLNFLRNHDELNLSRLPERDQETVFRAFAPEERMRIYGRGIRRRVPPMLGGDARRLRLAYSLLFSLPGTPVLLYGEEIGMGDDLSLPGRTTVRTPMQWSPGRNAGFSSADPERLIRPVVADGPFGCEKVNVVDQRRDPESLLNWMERAIRVRKQCPELGFGQWEVLDAASPSVLAHRCDWLDSSVLAVHNLAEQPAAVTLELGEQEVSELLADADYPAVDSGRVCFELAGHGYRWLRLRRPGSFEVLP